MLKIGIPIAGLVLLAFIAGGGAFLSAVSDGGGDAPDVVTVSARWSTAAGHDLEALTQAYPIVFVGTVERVSGQRTEQLAPEGVGARAVMPLTLFDVHVDEALAPGVSTGQTVTVQQAGGTITRRDGSEARVVLENDASLVAGATYLFFAIRAPSGADALVTAPYSRLPIGDSGLIGVAKPWQNLGAVRALSGSPLDAARVAIRTATGGAQ